LSGVDRTLKTTTLSRTIAYCRSPVLPPTRSPEDLQAARDVHGAALIYFVCQPAFSLLARRFETRLGGERRESNGSLTSLGFRLRFANTDALLAGAV